MIQTAILKRTCLFELMEWTREDFILNLKALHFYHEIHIELLKKLVYSKLNKNKKIIVSQINCTWLPYQFCCCKYLTTCALKYLNMDITIKMEDFQIIQNVINVKYTLVIASVPHKRKRYSTQNRRVFDKKSQGKLYSSRVCYFPHLKN